MRRSIPVLLLLLLVLAAPAWGQGDGAEDARSSPGAPTTVVTASREEEPWMDVPASISVVDEDDLARRFARTLPQALAEVPGVSVQETAYGQGSPYLRGFTGYRTLLLIDGIRLNNSVFRSGPNQYWATIDPFTVARLEVLRGPSSVMYGSDAIGGTVNALTRNPDTYGPGFQSGERLYYRFRSADSSHLLRGEVSATWGSSTGLLLGADGKVTDDLSGGRDTGTQPNTGYDEWAGDIKLEHFLDPSTRVVLAHQSLRQDDVPRTHRTVFAVPFEGTTVGSDLRRDFDQRRSLTYLQLHSEDLDGALSSFHASLSWQEQDEVRKRVNGGGTFSEQGIDVGTLGLFANGRLQSPFGTLTLGADWYRDRVDSFSSSEPIQGPVADDASYDLVGVFLQDEVELSERTTLTLGGRFNYADVNAGSVLDPSTSTRTDLQDDWSALVGSARFLYRIHAQTLHLFGGVSQGFRAPNLSDLTRLSSARSNEFEIPSPGLDPEDTTTWELGLKGRDRRASGQLAVFYTDVSDLILRRPTGNVDGAGQAEVVKENVGDGRVWGIEAESAVRIGGGWELFGGATFVEGKVETFPTSAPVIEEEYLDKLMPFTGWLGARWENEERWFELVARGAGDADKLSTADTLDTQRIPPGGTPAYVVFHVRGGIRLGKHLALDLALENLLDEDYRVHGSGLTMPGRSLVLGLTLAR